MKIGFITERMIQGFGVDMVIDRVGRGLAAKGHEVRVYASISDSTFGGADSYEIRMIPTPAYPLFPRYEFSARRHLDFLNSEDNDIYLIETFPFFSYLPKLRRPAVAVDHGISSTKGFPWKIRANFAYVRFMHSRYLKSARRIVTVSGYLKRELPEALQIKTTVIYNGADHYAEQAGAGAASCAAGVERTAAEGATLRKKLGVNEDEVLLLYVGRLGSADQPYKGTAELVEIYRKLHQDNPNILLLMVGFGGPRERLWLESEGALVIDNAPVEQMPAIFSACDIYVTCSRWEGFDLPIVEAQSFGKPVVGLKIGAHPEVVANGESGFLALSVAEMGDALLRLAGDKHLRQAMGGKALANAARFRWDDAVDRYERLLQEVVS